MAPDDLIGQTELPAHLPHFILEQFAQRLDQLPRQVGPQTPDVVVCLDRR